jgi:hypothetical protein
VNTLTREKAARIPQRFGSEEGWTDTVEYIMNPKNTVIRLMGRYWIFPEDGNVSLDIDLD